MAVFIEKNGAIVSLVVYVYNSNTLEIRKMNRPRIALEYRTKKLMQMISLRSYYVMNIQL